MKNKKILEQGLGVAVGLFVANSVLIPIISETSVARGARDGAIAGVLALVVYFIFSMLKPEKPSN